MKKSFIYLMVLLFVGLICGCKKNKPKPGSYIGEFIYTDPSTIDPMIELYVIKEVDEDYIQISRSFNGESLTSPTTLQKDNKKVTGILSSAMSANRQIDGTWGKNKGKYIIKGTFTQSGASPAGAYVLKGTFELKSQF